MEHGFDSDHYPLRILGICYHWAFVVQGIDQLLCNPQELQSDTLQTY